MANAMCHIHPEQRASAACENCYRPVCEACSVHVTAFSTRCAGCARDRRRIKRLLVALCTSAAVLLAAAVCFYLVRTETPAAAAVPETRASTLTPSFDYAEGTNKLRRLSSQLASEPCDKRNILELSGLMLRAGDARGAAREADGFLARCGELPELHRLLYQAYSQLSEPAAAAAQASKLLALEPHDATLLAHRALAYEQLGDWTHAEDDYVQALVFSPRLADIPINLANLYERQNKPCNAIFPLERIVFYYPNATNIDSIEARIDSLLSIPECAGMNGEGRAVLRIMRGIGSLPARVRLMGRETGNFIIDTGASYVAITRALAQRLALDLTRAPTLLFQTANGPRNGCVVILDQVAVQNAKAARVPAVVVDDLGGIDGLLGLSFLSRFDVTQTRDTVELVARRKRTAQLTQ
jgi:aspartyl protease family protein